MKVLQLPDVLHEYLVHVLLTYHAHPEEGVGMANLWDAVTKHVTHIDDAEVRKMAAAGAPPTEDPEPESNPNSASSVVDC
jgi:imidazolonepropionase-like amidohydrolase